MKSTIAIIIAPNVVVSDVAVDILLEFTAFVSVVLVTLELVSLVVLLSVLEFASSLQILIFEFFIGVGKIKIPKAVNDVPCRAGNGIRIRIIFT